MVKARVIASLGAAAVLVTAVSASAQCTKDTDCKGERVCDAGRCMAPPPAVSPPAPVAPVAPVAPASPAPSAAPAAPAPAPAEAPAAAPAPPAAAASPPAVAPAPAAESPAPVRMRRHSTAMMATGITMLSLSPVAAVISLVAAAQKAGCSIIDSTAGNGVAYDNKCDDYDATIYGFAIGSVALIGAGIPLTIVGAKSEPVPEEEASLSPWVTPHGAGTTLRLRW